MLEFHTHDIDVKLEKEIESFTRSLPKADCAFQNVKFFRFLSETKYAKPYIFISRSMQGDMQGFLLTSILKSYPFGKFGKRGVLWDGFVGINDPEGTIQTELLEGFKQQLASKVFYLEVRNMSSDIKGNVVYKSLGFTFRDWVGIKLQLNNKNDVWRGLSESKKRQIRKSEEAGVKLEEVSSDKELQDFYAILHDLYKKIKKPLPGFDFFFNFHESSLGEILLVKYKKKVVAGIVMVCEPGKGVYEWYIAGKDEEYRNIHPSVMATWGGIKYAMDNGFAFFDFMGGGKPDEAYGVRDFKKKFGAELKNYGRWYYSKYKGLLTFAEKLAGLKI